MFTTYLWCTYLKIFHLNFHVSSKKKSSENFLKSYKVKITYSNHIIFDYIVEIIIRN